MSSIDLPAWRYMMFVEWFIKHKPETTVANMDAAIQMYLNETRDKRTFRCYSRSVLIQTYIGLVENGVTPEDISSLDEFTEHIRDISLRSKARCVLRKLYPYLS